MSTTRAEFVSTKDDIISILPDIESTKPNYPYDISINGIVSDFDVLESPEREKKRKILT